MENEEHVSVDMEKLADSLSEELETLRPLCKECSIYRVPEPTRGFHPNHYTPQMVSIGPFHHGKEELKVMEEHKKRYLKRFLQRTKVRIARFLTFIKGNEAKLRHCYAETIHLKSDKFVTMVLVDAVFLIELFLREYDPDFITDDDRIFGKSELYWQIQHDLWKLENQLPLFILSDLFNLSKTATYGGLYEEISLEAITRSCFRDFILPHLPMEERFLEINFPKAEHFLDLIILSLQQSQSRARTRLLKDSNIPGAKALHQAGIKFKAVFSKNLLDINFNKGTLEIPFLSIYETTENLYRNLLAFESIHGCISYFNDYILMMSSLVSTPKDAEILIENEIVWGVDKETLANAFACLRKDCMFRYNFQYSDDVANLQAYCMFPFPSATTATSSQTAFGNANSVFAFGSAPAVPAFGQQSISPPSSFVFGSTASSGANLFLFGSQQNLGTPQNPSLFQATSSLDLNFGGSFSLGTDGGNKSQRRMVKIRKQRKK